MSDVNLLTVEEVEADEVRVDGGHACYARRADATIIASCERLARVEMCRTCKGKKTVVVPVFALAYDEKPCPDCKGHPGKAHKNAMDALRALGEAT